MTSAVVEAVVYVIGVLVAARARPTRRQAVVVAVALPIAAVIALGFARPEFSTDVYSYVAHGVVDVELDRNPHATATGVLAGTPAGDALEREGWESAGQPPSPYGPLWSVVERTVVDRIDGVDARVLALKLVAALAAAGCVLLVWSILGRVAPDHQFVGSFAFAWSPVTVVELGAEGHKDALMAFLALAAVWAWTHDRITATIVLLVGAVLTKYVPVILAPAFAVALWPDRRRALLGAVVAGAVGVLVFAPYWDGVATFDGVRATARLGTTGSTGSLAHVALDRIATSPDAVIRAVLAVVFTVGAVILAARRRPLLPVLAVTACGYLMLASPTYWPWYAALPIALLALVRARWALVVLVGLSVGARLAAPLDGWLEDGTIGQQTFVVLGWVAGIGLAGVAWLATPLVGTHDRVGARS